MSLIEKVNQWLILVTNLGVIAGFLLLALQLQQNTQALRVQVRANANATGVAAESAFMGENLAESYATAQLRPADLTPAQVMELNGFLVTKFVSFNQVYHDFLRGLATEQDWIQAKKEAIREISWPFGRAWWTATKRYFIGINSDFPGEIDKELAENNGINLSHTADILTALGKELN